MRSGHVDKVTRATVSGWAADDVAPGLRLELRVRVNGRERGVFTAAQPREDLKALGRFGDGAHGFSFTFAEEISPDLDNLVVVTYADSNEIVPNGEHVLPKVPPPERIRPAPAAGPGKRADTDLPAPILVSAPGRSGTTYLMSCLAASPQIVAAELVPYEVRLLAYYATAHGVLTGPADTARSTHPDRLEADRFHVGTNPFSAPGYLAAFKNKASAYELFDHWGPDRLGESMGDIVREYYRRLAADQGKPGAAYFAEKNNNLSRTGRRFARRYFPGLREIVLVRDPRDVICSHMSWFRAAPETAFAELSQACGVLVQLREQVSDDLCVIRYEDLVRGDSATFAALRAFLDADVRPQAVERGAAIFKKHATSASPAASIGRWQQDLPSALRGEAQSQWGGFFDTFGYAGS